MVTNIASQHIVSSLKCITFVISEAETIIIAKIQYKTLVAVDSRKATHEVTKTHVITVYSEYALFTLLSQQTKSLQEDIAIILIDSGVAVFIISDNTAYLTLASFLQPTHAML